jgi:hypothetical protein
MTSLTIPEERIRFAMLKTGEAVIARIGRDSVKEAQGAGLNVLTKENAAAFQMGGNWPHQNMHLHTGVPHGGLVEFHLRGWRVVDTCYDGAVSPVNGWATLPETPGLGYTPKDGIVREYAAE